MRIHKKPQPHFLDVFLPNLTSNRLKVPSKFVNHLGDRTSGSLSLIGPSGNEWRVNLYEYDGHLFFREGWPTFVKDHAIQCGDTLVFRYDGNSKFTVQIFDDTSCEKHEAFFANCTQRASESIENLGKKRERDVEAALLKIVDEKKMRGSSEPAPQVSSAGKAHQKSKKNIKKKKKSKKTITSEYDITPKNIVQASDRTVVLASPSLTQTDIVNYHVKRIASKVKKSWKTKKKTDNKKVPSISKFIESRAAHYFTSTSPYFVRVMCYSNINGHNLKVPTHFSSLHFPKCRIRVTLININGDCWVVNSVPTFRRSTTIHALCAGWVKFVRANDIKIEDVCIFELVDEFKLRVHILRLGLEGLEFQLGSQNIVDVDGVGIGLGKRYLEMIDNVAQDERDNLAKDHDDANEPFILQEAVPSIDTVEDNIAVVDPSCASASSMGSGNHSTSDELLLQCDDGGTISYLTSGKKLDFQAMQTMHLQPSAEETRDTLSFTSPFPNFRKVMMSSNVGGVFTLAIPRNFSGEHLPGDKRDVILRNLRGDSWNVVSTRYGKQTKFCRGWKSFVRMNNLKVGDLCVFELLGEREFQVHVFEGSQKIPECVLNEAVVDDSMASVVSMECGILSEL